MSEDELIGTQLANYRLEHRLGRGGMASVYYATDVNLQRPVAVKLIDERYQGDMEVARRFVDEARLIARWRHENVIQVHYAGQEDGVFFFAMEYIEGMSLAELMADYTASDELMPQADVIRIGRAVAAALDYAHQQGVIHRDVKPSNVMISYDDRVVLADFGLALDLDQGTLGQIFGTPHYIAPEQVRSSAEVVPQSDVYALGVILFEMLTGSVPFDDPSAATVAIQHLNAPPPLPRSINPALNLETELVLLRVLEKEASQRYQTGAALSDALAEALAADAPVSTKELATVSTLPVCSQLSVADKVAVHLEHEQAQPVSQGPRYVTPTRPGDGGQQTQAAPGLSRGWLVAGVVLVLFLIGVGGLALLSRNNTSATPAPLPTSAVMANDSTEAATADISPIPSEPLAATLRPTEAVAVIVAVSSDTPIPVSTLAPSATPVPTDTAMPPTATTQVAMVAPAPTVLYPEGRRFQLFWDAYSFYVWNGSGSNSRVSPFSFEALASSGTALPDEFDGGRWSMFYRWVEGNKCVGIEIGRAPAYLRPAQCRGYNSVVNPVADDPMVFWTGQGGAVQFRVLWNGQEVGRCAIDAMTCQVMLPPE